jgi:hypothetical protein
MRRYGYGGRAPDGAGGLEMNLLLHAASISVIAVFVARLTSLQVSALRLRATTVRRDRDR